MTKPDIICMAEWVTVFQSVELSPHFEASYGLLGTTEVIWLCSIAVLEVMESQSLMENVKK
jgi:hypothetical protein